jgi:hypothetical protein
MSWVLSKIKNSRLTKISSAIKLSGGGSTSSSTTQKTSRSSDSTGKKEIAQVANKPKSIADLLAKKESSAGKKNVEVEESGSDVVEVEGSGSEVVEVAVVPPFYINFNGSASTNESQRASPNVTAEHVSEFGHGNGTRDDGNTGVRHSPDAKVEHKNLPLSVN